MKKLLITYLALLGLAGPAAAQQTTPINFETHEIVEIQAANFDEVTHFSKPVIIDVYANRCGYCTKLDPIFKELSQDLRDKYLFAKLNHDKEPSLVGSLNVRGFPTLLFIKDGKEVGRHVGYANKTQLTEEINKYFAN